MYRKFTSQEQAQIKSTEFSVHGDGTKASRHTDVETQSVWGSHLALAIMPTHQFWERCNTQRTAPYAQTGGLYLSLAGALNEDENDMVAKLNQSGFAVLDKYK